MNFKSGQIYRAGDPELDGKYCESVSEYRIQLIDKDWKTGKWKCKCWLPLLVAETVWKEEGSWENHNYHGWLEETGRMVVEEPKERLYSEEEIEEGFVIEKDIAEREK